MFFTSVFLCVAVLVATVASASAPLSDLEALVMLTADWTQKDESWTANASSACNWNGTSCEFGYVIEFAWAPFPECEGTVKTAYLPRNLEILALDGNRFSGSVDFTQLPPTLVNLGLSYNMFSGRTNVTRLPEGLQTFRIEHNQFSGSLDFDKLPWLLMDINIASNFFDGQVPSLTTLPFQLTDLLMQNNNFCGSTPIVNADLAKFDVSPCVEANNTVVCKAC